jgi:hypothetical protein
MISVKSFSNEIVSYVNNDMSQLTTSLVDNINHDDSFNKFHVEPTEFNSCISCVNTCSVQLLEHSIQDSILDNNAQNNLTINDKLQLLISKFKVSHNFSNGLLQLLRSESLDVPKHVRTLIKTPKNHTIVNISGGSYIHLGLRNMLLPILSRNNAQKFITSHTLKIGINIDGLLISKSSKCQLWPILISILNFKELKKNVIPIGIFHGFNKPESIEEYLNPLIIDLLEVIDYGIK